MDDCYFCKCLEGKKVVLENNLAFAIFDGYPVNRGHLLIISKRHIQDWWEATIDEKLAIINLLDEAKALIDKKISTRWL